MKSIAVIGNCDKPGIQSALSQIKQWATAAGVQVESNIEDNEGSKSAPPTGGPFGPSTILQLRERFAAADLIVTLGGDGTLLFSTQIAAPLGIPTLSVNLGSLGFHTQVAPSVLIGALEKVAHGDHRIEKRLLLEATLLGTDLSNELTSMIALNDVVVSKSSWGHMVHLRLQINGRPATDLSADGLLISTPTGSTAYNYAAGGPLLDPGMEALVISAICPHRMQFAPLVVPAVTELIVDFQPQKPVEEAQFIVDGQPCRRISHNERLKISKSPMYLPLVVFDHDFYGKLREKLRWGGFV